MHILRAWICCWQGVGLRTYNLGRGTGRKRAGDFGSRTRGDCPCDSRNDWTAAKWRSRNAYRRCESHSARYGMGCEGKRYMRTLESAWHWHRLHPQGYRIVQEERFNPFWNRWVNIAAHRADRPWRGETQLMEGAN